MSDDLFRVHESNGQLHFHNDAAGLKVSIPVQEFIARYTDYMSMPKGDLIFTDLESMTSAILTYEETVNGQIVSASLDVRLERIDTLVGR